MTDFLSNLAKFTSGMAAAMRASQETTKAKQGAITLTPDEAQLVSIAMTEFGGAFPVGRMVRRTGLTSHRIKTLAQYWESCGLLTTAYFGDSRARQVTPRLAEMARSVRQGG
jgi:hypothetical protein